MTGYLARAAQALGGDLMWILDVLGLPRDATLFIGADDPTRRVLVEHLRLTPSEIQAMSLLSFRALGIDASGLTALRARRGLDDHGIRRAHALRCPLCAQEHPGYVNLAWHLDIAFVCTDHRVFLTDSCHVCEQPGSGKWFKPGHAWRPDTCGFAPKGRECGALIRDRPIRSASPSDVALQRALLSLLRTDRVNDLADVRLSISLANVSLEGHRADAGHVDFAGRAARLSRIEVAEAAKEVAMPLIEADEHELHRALDRCFARISPLKSRQRLRRSLSEKARGPILQPLASKLADPAIRRREAWLLDLPADVGLDIPLKMIPPVLSAEVFRRHVEPFVRGPKASGGWTPRVLISLMIARLAGCSTWRHAVEALGLPSDTVNTAYRTWISAAQLARYARASHELALRMDTSGRIDFPARLSTLGALTSMARADVREVLGLSNEPRQRRLPLWLWVVVGCGHPDLAPRHEQAISARNMGHTDRLLTEDQRHRLIGYGLGLAGDDRWHPWT